MPITTTFITQAHASIPKGQMISQDPAQGTVIDPENGIVVVTLSSGPSFAKSLGVSVKHFTFVSRVTR